MELLTFLGTGNYNTTNYTWQDQTKETPYVAEALAEFLKPKKIQIFVTPEAKEKHSQAFLNRIDPSYNSTFVDIPSGQSETEIWQIFEAVVNAVSSNTEISFDITHAFRSLPLLVLLAGAFLQKAKNVNIRGVYYGAFEVNRDQPPIFDLTSAIKLLDWLTATDKFLTTGSAVELGNLLTTIQGDFYKQNQPQKGEARPTQLKGFGDKILKFSQSLEYVRAMDTLDDAGKIQQFSTERLSDEIGVFAKPFELLLNPIQEQYGQFAVANSRESDVKLVLEKQFLLLRWYVSKQLGTQAILLAREWIISAFCYLEEVDYLSRDERGKIEQQLGKMIGLNRTLEQPIITFVQDVEVLSSTWSKLTEYRNDIAHCQMRETGIAADNLGRYIKNNLLDDLSRLFPELVI